MDNMTKLELLIQLKDAILIEHKPDWFYPRMGLCGNWDAVLANNNMPGFEKYRFKYIFRQHIEAWELYTEDLDYPVPHSNVRPANGYHDHRHELYDLNTEYGRNRLSLLNHIISCVEKELETN